MHRSRAQGVTKVAKEKGFTNLVHFFDDGISGVTMERPGFQKMLAELEQGHAAAVIVKDMSRLGRNYIEVGRLTEEFFPDHDIRLIAVSDGIDTDEGENELAPIRNLFKNTPNLGKESPLNPQKPQDIRLKPHTHFVSARECAVKHLHHSAHDLSCKE